MLHHFGRFLHQPAPLFSGFGADFPETVVFIADAPVFYLIRPGAAVFNTPFGIFPFSFQVAVFHPVAHFFCGSGSCIGTDVGFTADFAAHFYVFIRTEGIGILHSPGFIKKRLSVFSHAVLPVVGGDKAASGPAEYGNLYPAHGFYDIRAHTVLIR